VPSSSRPHRKSTLCRKRPPDDQFVGGVHRGKRPGRELGATIFGLVSDRRYSTARWQRLRKAVLAHVRLRSGAPPKPPNGGVL
jgi:hypothetical protein